MSEDAWHSRALADDDAPGHSTHGADSGVHGNSKTDDLKDDRISHAAGRETAPVFSAPVTSAPGADGVANGMHPTDAHTGSMHPASAPSAEAPSHGPPYGGTHAGETPDVLRWRAEMLLDEMMIGAVDSSAGARAGSYHGNGSHEGHEGTARNGASASENHRRTDKTNGTKHAALNRGEWKDAELHPHESPAEPDPGAAYGDYDSAHDAGRNPGPAAPSSRHSIAPSTRAPQRITPAMDSTSDGTSDGTIARGDHSAASDPYSPVTGPFDVSPQSESSTFAWSASSREAGAVEPSHMDGAVETAKPYTAPNWSVSSSEDESSAAHAYRDPLLYEAAGEMDAGRAPTRPGSSHGPYIPSSYASAGKGQVANVGNGTASASSQDDPYDVMAAGGGNDSMEGGVGTGAPATQQPSARMASPYIGPRDPHPYDDETARRLTAVESRYPRPAYRPPPQPYANGSGGAHSDLSYDDLDAAAPGLGPVRRNPAVINGSSVNGSLAGAMAVGGRNAKYAALLPRSTPWDVHEMEREIASLADEMARVLPAGHESSRRARHLLEKAQSIFGSDPLRSAEVDYYLSQVRAIVQRSRQTLEWSLLYRKRLTLYLGAWIAFSLVCILGALLFAPQMTTQAAVAMRWSPDGFWGQGFAAAWLALFGGSLGGALGARYNLHRFRQQGTGFVDRKYGLRTLILPLMGMLAGFVTFLFLGGLLWLMGISTTDSLLLMLLPAAVAFSLSALQEHIYGTRD